MQNQTYRPPANPSATFLVGQDAEGHWLARATSGACGGLFTSRDAALHYALFETGFRRETIALVEGELALGL